ncbi:MAG: O-antigen ligase family protein [Alphaproteobacteria bacterium]|nr:O-antigen ligase family protein [Alphaproteobacteria bacterium]
MPSIASPGYPLTGLGTVQSRSTRGPAATAAGFAETVIVFILLVLFAGVIWPPDSYFAAPLPPRQGVSNIYDFCEFLVLLGFLAVGFYVRRRQLPALAVWGWPVLLLASVAFASAFWADDPAIVLRRAGTATLSSLFGFYLVARGDLAALTALLVKVYALAAAASIVLALAVPRWGTMMGEAYTHAWRGVYADKNDLGMACAEALIVAVYALRRGYGARWVAAFALVASVALVAASQSKTPIVVTGAALYAALLAAALRRRSAAGIAAAFVLFVAGLAVAGALAVGWQDALAALGRDATLTNRTRIWRLVLEEIARHPWLGYGYEAFWRDANGSARLIWDLVGFHTPHAHNGWLEIWLGLGVVGLAAATMVWLVAGYRVLRVATAPEAGHVAFCAAIFAGTFIENLTEFEFFRPGRLMWALFVAALVYLGREVTLHRAAAARGIAPRPGALRSASAIAR